MRSSNKVEMSQDTPTSIEEAVSQFVLQMKELKEKVNQLEAEIAAKDDVVVIVHLN